jgi:hypothetical protein
MTKAMNYDSTLSLLARQGMTLCEYFVMCSVDYRIGANPERLANDSWQFSQGDRRGEFPLEAHVAAVASCIAKGWLTVLTEEDVERELSRRRHSELPELEDSGVWPGAVDFTQTGYEIHRDIICKIFGVEHQQYGDCGSVFLEDRDTFQILAPTLESCRKRIEDIVSETESWCGFPAEVVAVSGPFRIGPWRRNRFIVFPEGYRAEVRYRRT